MFHITPFSYSFQDKAKLGTIIDSGRKFPCHLPSSIFIIKNVSLLILFLEMALNHRLLWVLEQYEWWKGRTKPMSIFYFHVIIMQIYNIWSPIYQRNSEQWTKIKHNITIKINLKKEKCPCWGPSKNLTLIDHICTTIPKLH